MGNNRHNSEIGRKGEDIACRYLMDRGHTVLHRNWRSGHLETDIITMDKNGIHFVEVKSRAFPMQARPEESVTRLKQRRLARAAEYYLRTREGRETGAETELHFDVVSVVFSANEIETQYFPDAFIPGL